jgi:hypothetical protein
MTNLFNICKYRVLASILGIGKLSGLCRESIPQTGIPEIAQLSLAEEEVALQERRL